MSESPGKTGQRFHLTEEHQLPLINASVTKALIQFIFDLVRQEKTSTKQRGFKSPIPHLRAFVQLSQAPSAPEVSSSFPTKLLQRKKPKDYIRNE